MTGRRAIELYYDIRCIGKPHPPILDGQVIGKSAEGLEDWLRYYTYERPHQGYRNLGRKPFDTLASFLPTVNKEA